LGQQAPASAAAGGRLRPKCTRPNGDGGHLSAPSTHGSFGERFHLCWSTSINSSRDGSASDVPAGTLGPRFGAQVGGSVLPEGLRWFSPRRSRIPAASITVISPS
jgi:hypothetical protein